MGHGPAAGRRRRSVLVRLLGGFLVLVVMVVVATIPLLLVLLLLLLLGSFSLEIGPDRFFLLLDRADGIGRLLLVYEGLDKVGLWLDHLELFQKGKKRDIGGIVESCGWDCHGR